MRKIFSTVMLVAAAAMTFASCQREEMNAPKETFSTTLTLNTEVDATKTYLGADNTVLWGENESVTLFVKDSNEEPATTFVNSASTSDFNGEASASFTFELTGIAESASYTIGGIYPESVSNGIDNKNAAAYKINLPATQNASVDNYDPSAFIMVLKPETVETVPSTYTASFRRAVALNKITLTGVKENISSVEITVEPSQEGLYLAGRRYVDLTTAEFGDIYYGQTNTVTVNAPYTGSSIDVWFTSWGMDLKSGDKLTVKMTSATKTYTRTITANENGIKFVEGDLNTLKINMASAEEVVLENLSGKYLVVGKKNDNWSLMAPTASTYIAAYATTVAATNTACAAFYEIANIESYVWTATAVDGGYTLSSCDGKFVSYPNNGENHANLVQSSVTLGLDIDDTQKATVIDMVSGRALKYNASSPRFAFYPSGQTDIYFIPWVEDTTPRIFVSSDLEQAVGADGGEVKIEYTLKNLDGKTLTVEETSDFVSASVATGVVTVTVDANEATESRSATLTLKCGEAAPVSVTVNQAGKQAAGGELKTWSWTGGGKTAFEQDANVIKTNGLGTDYASSNAPYLIKLDGTGDYFIIQVDGAIQSVSIDVKMLGGSSTSTLDVQGSADGTTFTSVQNLTISGAQNAILNLSTTKSFDSSYRYVKFYFTKGSNVGVGPMSITYMSGSTGDEPTDPTPDPEEPGTDGTQYYVKVTTATPGAGTYLYVSSEGYAFTGDVSDNSWGQVMSVSVVDDKIEATDAVNAYAITLEEGSTSGQYAVKLPNGQYLTTTTSKPSSATTASYMTYDPAKGLGSVSTTSYYFLSNSSSSHKFRWYSSNQKSGYLYKLN